MGDIEVAAVNPAENTKAVHNLISYLYYLKIMLCSMGLAGSFLVTDQTGGRAKQILYGRAAAPSERSQRPVLA